jgi:DICT domain-containing protein
VSDPGRADLSIGDVSERTGLSEGTLRMWETRHGFPRPQRLESGHRRYGEHDVEVLRKVLEERGRGLSLKAAIERVNRASVERERSVFAGLRRRRPQLAPHLLPKRSLLAISHAIEDELCARAERVILFGSFQHERFYRQSAPRWRELARTADFAVALGDFPRPRHPRGSPVELPLERSDPMLREWALVCTGPGYGACLAGVERPGQVAARDDERRFETLWSVDPAVVHDAAHICCELVASPAPRLARRIARLLDRVGDVVEDRYDVAAALTSRIVAYLGQGGSAEHRSPPRSA